MKLKTFKIITFFLAVALTFLFHNIYKWFPNNFTAIFFPVNESIWEHMKILFGSILVAGVIGKIYIKINKLPYKNVCISNYVSALISIPIFLAMYLPVYYTINDHLPITIFIMIIAILISEYISYLIIKKDNMHLENFTIILVIITYFIFGLLTFNSPKKHIFYDTIKKCYGINCYVK